MSTETEQRNGGYVTNDGYNNAGVIHIRINTEELIQKIRDFLSGEEIIVARDENDDPILTRQRVGDKICTDAGVRMITNLVGGVVNPSVVQGNYTKEKYELECELLHKDLAFILMVNYAKWDIDEDNLDAIIGFIMNLVRPFLSRLIDNKERDSYGSSMRVSEVNRVDSRGGFSLFGGKGGAA